MRNKARRHKSTFMQCQIYGAVKDARTTSSAFAKLGRRKKTIIGCCNNSSVKAVKNLRYLHVYRQNPGTTADHLSSRI